MLHEEMQDNAMVLADMKEEMKDIDIDRFPQAHRLLKEKIAHLESDEPEPEYLEVDVQTPIHISKKILIPVNRHPKFNFVGKLLGPKGKTLKELSTNNRCRIFIFGSGSTRSKDKEDKLIQSDDPQYSHLREPLHVKVNTTAPAPEAYQRLGNVLQELSRYMQPVKDDLVYTQMEELGLPMPGENGSTATAPTTSTREGGYIRPSGRRSRFDPEEVYSKGAGLNKRPRPDGMPGDFTYAPPMPVPRPPPVIGYPGFYYQGATPQEFGAPVFPILQSPASNASKDASDTKKDSEKDSAADAAAEKKNNHSKGSSLERESNKDRHDSPGSPSRTTSDTQSDKNVRKEKKDKSRKRRKSNSSTTSSSRSSSNTSNPDTRRKKSPVRKHKKKHKKNGSAKTQRRRRSSSSNSSSSSGSSSDSKDKKKADNQPKRRSESSDLDTKKET